jgi:hypothetical protein
MVQVTLQLIEGLERGQVFTDLPTPVSIGREDDNVVRLNDERVSRFHAKIQEDGGQLILTDLDSTNGTRVNGHPVQMRVLRVGDQLSIGRCLMIVGSREDISARAAQLHDLRQPDLTDKTIAGPDGMPQPAHDSDGSQPPYADLEEQIETLFPDGPPQPPEGLGPLQRAEFSDFLAYTHEQILQVLHAGVRSSDDDDITPMTVNWLAWQRLLGLQMELSVYLRKLAEPDE